MKTPYYNFNNLIDQIREFEEIVYRGKKETDNSRQKTSDSLGLKNKTKRDNIFGQDKIIYKSFIVYSSIILEEMIKDYFIFYSITKKINKINYKSYKDTFQINLKNIHKITRESFVGFIQNKLKEVDINNTIDDEDLNLLKEIYIERLPNFRNFRLFLYLCAQRNLLVHNNGVMNNRTYNIYPIAKIGDRLNFEFNSINLIIPNLRMFNSFLDDSFGEQNHDIQTGRNC